MNSLFVANKQRSALSTERTKVNEKRENMDRDSLVFLAKLAEQAERYES